jgi:outer membrane protein assembly factor BamA
VPAPLLAGTVEAATLVAAGKAAGVASATAAALTKGVFQAMFVNKLKVAAAVFLAVSAVGVRVGLPGPGTRGPGRAGAVLGDEVVGNNRPHKDTRVAVQEANTGSLLFGVGVNSDAGLTGSIMFNERNFDITRPPTSLDDILNGSAFRGAGQELRIEAVPGTQLQRYTTNVSAAASPDHQDVGGINTPVYERYFAGGFRTLRGFEFRGVSPDVNGFKTGGDFLFLNSAEYQIPVQTNDQIYIVPFVDSGTVASRTDQVADYRVTAGFGVRFEVPMLGPVPIALDFGFPIVKEPDDREQGFNFWLGFFG